MKKENAVCDDGRIMLRQSGSVQVQTRSGSVLIDPGELLYAEEYRHKTSFVFAKERIDSNVLLTAVEPMLSSFGFFRCHRNYIVSLCKITFIGDEYITMENGDSIPLSIQRRDAFLSQTADSRGQTERSI